MKSNIPTPVVVIVVVALVALVGVFLWKKTSGTAGTAEVKTMATEMNQGKPSTDAPPPEVRTEGAMLMGGGKKGTAGR